MPASTARTRPCGSSPRACASSAIPATRVAATAAIAAAIHLRVELHRPHASPDPERLHAAPRVRCEQLGPGRQGAHLVLVRRLHVELRRDAGEQRILRPTGVSAHRTVPSSRPRGFRPDRSAAVSPPGAGVRSTRRAPGHRSRPGRAATRQRAPSTARARRRSGASPSRRSRRRRRRARGAARRCGPRSPGRGRLSVRAYAGTSGRSRPARAGPHRSPSRISGGGPLAPQLSIAGRQRRRRRAVGPRR